VYVDHLKEVVVTNGVPIVTRIVGAISLWVVGRWLIRLAHRFVHGASVKRLDPTLVRYLESALNLILSVLLFLAVLSIFGVETTSFAGLIAAAGVAIGVAWSGLLSNFAAGIFILALRPFQVGDQVTINGISGLVQEIGLFHTGIDTGDNVRTWVGNTKILSENIMNFTVNGWRRVEVKVTLPAGANMLDVLSQLQEAATKVPNILPEPKPTVQVSSLADTGTVAVRVSAPPGAYGQIVDDLNRAAAELLLRQPGVHPQPPAKPPPAPL
jgi:small conductance mechanosensitive channel